MQLKSHISQETRKTLHSATRNLRLVIFESSITAGMLSMSIMTPFFRSIGMSQSEIALSQAIFTVMALLLNLPTGWIADRFSRKWANIIGDFGVAISLFCYSQVQGFYGVVACECLLGLFNALSQGVDSSLLKHFSARIDSREDYFHRQAARLSFWQYCCTFTLVLLGGPIGAFSFRWAIALSGLPALVGGIASIFITDDSEKLIPEYCNPLRDVGRIITSAWRNPRLRLRIFAYAVGREMTHAMVWVYTPLMLYAGIPLTVVSCAWALNSLSCIAGSYLASRHTSRLRIWQIFAYPFMLMMSIMLVLSIQINLFTIGVYLLTGMVQGWTGATLLPLVQDEAPSAEQTSIISLTKVAGQILYIPTVYIVGLAADVNLHFAPLSMLIMFVPLGGLIIAFLRRE